MNIEAFRDYCISKKGVTESFPFDSDTLVMKVLDKIFALTDMQSEFRINLKCDPETALELRENYNSVKPAYHMNKKHWNTIYIDNSIPDKLIYKWIDDSYNLVVNSLKKTQQKQLEEM